MRWPVNESSVGLLCTRCIASGGSGAASVGSGDHAFENVRDGLAGECEEGERESTSMCTLYAHVCMYEYFVQCEYEVAGLRSAPRERDVREAVPGHREHLHDAEDEREPRDLQLHTRNA